MCGIKFWQKNNLWNHIQTVYKKIFRYTCSECGKGFSVKSRMDIHTKVVHQGVTFDCEVCKRPFRSKAKRDSHQLTHDPNYKRPQYECDQCDKIYLSYDKFCEHKRFHENGAPDSYLCEVCSKTLVTKTALDLHMRIHTGEKRFECDFCDKKFAQAVYLKFHRRTHTNEKPYACGYCEARFANSTSLKVHVRSHTAERPYTCSVCLKSYFSKSALNRHPCRP